MRTSSIVSCLASSLLGSALVVGACSAQAIGPKPEHAVGDTRGQSEFEARLDDALRAIESDPRLKGVPREKLRGVAEFVVGNLLFVMLHESGHALISDLYLYV